MRRFILYIAFSVVAVVSFCQCKDNSADCLGGHKFVDLGLSVLWADCNVGADKSTDFGNWYAWGETKSKEWDDWHTYLADIGGEISSYKDCGTDKDPLKSYVAPNATSIASTKYDVASVKWSEVWRTPTKTEFDELIEKCTFEWTTKDGVRGGLVTGPNGNSIFLPAGHDKDMSSMGYEWPYCYYWTSTPNEDYSYCAWYFYFNYKHKQNMNYYDRFTGLLVRPVTARP